jgi:hypothetical protein
MIRWTALAPIEPLPINTKRKIDASKDWLVFGNITYIDYFLKTEGINL